MNATNEQAIKQATRGYIYVFLALLAGTIITVVASYIHFGHHVINVAVALAIAATKAFLVAGYFMHLISERKLIYGLLAATGFFFLGLMLLIVGSDVDQLKSLSH